MLRVVLDFLKILNKEEEEEEEEDEEEDEEDFV